MKMFTQTKPRPPPNREPLMTFSELAQEFGVSKNALIGYMVMHKNAGGLVPTFQLKHPKKTYYKPSEMRAWWASIQPKGESDEQSGS